MVLQFLQWYNITPAVLSPYAPLTLRVTVIGFIIVLVVLVVIGIRRLTRSRAPVPPEIFANVADKLSLNAPQQPFQGQDLDHRLNHVEARLFFPWYFSLGPLSHFFGKRRDLNHVPRTKLIIDKSEDEKKAYLMGEYAQRLLTPIQKIQWTFERKPLSRLNLDKWCKRNGFTYVPRLAIKADLEENRIQCPTCPERFVPRGVSSKNPVLHLDNNGGMYYYTLCPACGNSVRSPTEDSTLGVFVVSTKQPLSSMHQIDVLVPSGETISREARFYGVSIGVPLKAENALNLKLLYCPLGLKDQGQPVQVAPAELDKIPIYPTPTMTVKWENPRQFRSNNPEDFASALIEGGRIREQNLSTGTDQLHLAIFVVLFTVEGSDLVFFPSHANKSGVEMAAKFQVEVYAEANNKPLTFLTKLDVQVHDWQTIKVVKVV